MKVKKYEAPTLQEALLLVKTELGSEAVVLHTKKFQKGGFLGLGKKEMVEVLAATETRDDGADPARPAQVRKPVPTQQQNDRSASLGFGAVPPPPPRGQQKNADKELRDELSEIKTALFTLMKNRASEAASDSLAPYPRLFGDLYLKFIENGVDDAIAQDIIRSLDEALANKADRDSEELVYSALGRILRRLLKVSGVIELPPGGGPKTVAFVGPTGVGKTTTIAKIATVAALAKHKKVGIITSDTFRIAAVEQIKTYGDIIGVPVRVAYNREDMKHAMDFLSGSDLILVDTAGRSQWDQDKIRDLSDLLTACYPLDIHLVLGANIRYGDMVEVADRFRPVSYNHLIFTKNDETSSHGSIINMITRVNLGVSYLCYGQNVPGEIQEATPETLISMTIGEPINKVFNMQGR